MEPEHSGKALADEASKATTLSEALPYIREFQGTTVVVKYGGSAMESPTLTRSVMTDIVLMRYVGIHTIVVHGGGKEISRFMEQLGRRPQFVDGLRVSDAATVELAEMVLAGKINKALVAAINAAGGRGVGISGKDASLLKVQKHEPVERQGVKVDLGFVGRITGIDGTILEVLTGAGCIPVVAPLGGDEAGHTYNINADTVAGELAAALGADKLVLMTDVEGIMSGPNGDLMPTLHIAEVEKMIASGQLAGGMIPKVEACAQALDAGVRRTHIINGCRHHSLLLEIFTDEGVGTMVVDD